MINTSIKYLGIDWGESKIGLAIGDSENKIAIPFLVVKDWHEILNVIKSEEIAEVIVGEPKSMNGNITNKEKFFSFVGVLKEKTSLPIHTIDERLTSKAADALPGAKKEKAEQDAIAAMLILQSYLDRLA